MRNQDSTLVDYRAVRLVDVIEEAYGLEVQFGSALASMWLQGYDIQARIPPDTPAGQLPAMLRGLLSERFGLKVHGMSGEREVYWMVVGKDG